MKREDFYIQEATKYSQSEILNAEALAFIAGMKMADTHPNWIKVEDRLPENDDDILIYLYKPFYEEWELSIAFYDKRLGEFWTNDGYKAHPTYWMPIVLPKED